MFAPRVWASPLWAFSSRDFFFGGHAPLQVSFTSRSTHRLLSPRHFADCEALKCSVAILVHAPFSSRLPPQALVLPRELTAMLTVNLEKLATDPHSVLGAWRRALAEGI
jgi:hypothetical protein